MAFSVPLDKCSKDSFSNQATIIFGGTFDPIHLGHVSVIRSCLSLCPRLLLAATAQNPWKQTSATALNIRKEMIHAVLAAEKIPVYSTLSEKGVHVSDLAYVYAEEIVTSLRTANARAELYWVVGEDAKDEVSKWRNWNSLSVTTLIAPIVINVHATNIRENPSLLHPALLPIAKKHHLYGL